MKRVVRLLNRDMTIKEIAQRIGKTPRQVQVLMKRRECLRMTPNGRNLENLFG